MSCDLKLVPDVEFIHQDGMLNSKFVLLGSKSANSFIKMNETTYLYASEIIEMLQSNKTQDEISKEMSDSHPEQKINVAAFIDRLRIAGLLCGYEKVFDDEMDLLGVKVFNIKFKQSEGREINLLIKAIYSLFSSAIIWCPLLIFLTLVLNSYFGFEIRFVDRPLENVWIDLIATIILTILCFLVHELGHAIAAVYSGVRIKEFSIAFYFGLIPTFFFRYHDMKSVSPRTKLKIVSAGIYSNIIFAILFFLLSVIAAGNHTTSTILYRFAYFNAIMILGNLLPARLSDGYYMLSLLLNKYDIRVSLWRNIVAQSRDRKKPNKLIVAYGMLMVASLVYTLFTTILSVLNYLRSGNYAYGFGLLIVVSVMLCVATYNIKKKSKRI